MSCTKNNSFARLINNELFLDYTLIVNAPLAQVNTNMHIFAHYMPVYADRAEMN